MDVQQANGTTTTSTGRGQPTARQPATGGTPAGEAGNRPAAAPSLSDRAALVTARAAIAAAVLAGFGLIASGVSTFYAARVAQAQVDQISQQLQAEERKDASKVALWSQNGKNMPSLISREIHIANRSQETFYNARLGIQVSIDEPNGDRYAVVSLFTFMPCTELTISLDKLKTAPKDTWNNFPGKNMLDTALFISDFSIEFQDSNGVSWHKTPMSLSHGPVGQFPMNAPNQGKVTGIAFSDLEPPTPVPGCGPQDDDKS